MRKVWRVARCEYLNIVRTKAFILGVVLMPFFMGGTLVVQKLLADKQDVSDRRFAVVDRTGRLLPALQAAAEQRNVHAIFDGDEQVKPRFRASPAADDPAALSARVRSGDLFAYVVIGAEVIEGDGKAADAQVAYHTGTPTYLELPQWISRVVDEAVREIRFEQHGLDRGLVERLSRPVPLRQFGLVEVTEHGEVKDAEEVNEAVTFGVPAVAMVLLFMLVMMAAPALLNNVLEEKMQRIAEVLVASVTPFELFLGKLLGTVFVSWTLSALYVGGVAYVAYATGFARAIPLALYFWFPFFQLLALLIYGSIFSAVGASCSEMRDAQAMMMPVTLLLVLPMLLWIVVLQNPGSPFSIAVSLVPPCTPFLMLLRLAIPPGPAPWEIALGVVLTLLFTLGCVWAGARIFRIGILAQGQAPSFRRLLGWVFARQ